MAFWGLCIGSRIFEAIFDVISKFQCYLYIKTISFLICQKFIEHKFILSINLKRNPPFRWSIVECSFSSRLLRTYGLLAYRSLFMLFWNWRYRMASSPFLYSFFLLICCWVVSLISGGSTHETAAYWWSMGWLCSEPNCRKSCLQDANGLLMGVLPCWGTVSERHWRLGAVGLSGRGTNWRNFDGRRLGREWIWSQEVGFGSFHGWLKHF